MRIELKQGWLVEIEDIHYVCPVQNNAGTLAKHTVEIRKIN